MSLPAVTEPGALPVEPARHPYHVYLDSLTSPESRRTMRGCLDRLARLLTGDESATGAGQPWHLLRYEHTVRIRTMLTDQGWSAAYVNKHLVALRRVLKEAWRLGQTSAEDLARASDLAPVRQSRLPTGHHVPPEVVGAALSACDDSPAGVRDAALIAVLYSTGCRRAELGGLALADYDPGALSLRVRGKRDKERMVYLTTDAIGLVERWLAVRGTAPGALFSPISKAGRLRAWTWRRRRPWWGTRPRPPRPGTTAGRSAPVARPSTASASPPPAPSPDPAPPSRSAPLPLRLAGIPPLPSAAGPLLIGPPLALAPPPSRAASGARTAHRRKTTGGRAEAEAARQRRRD
ncbi:tyrosine-type recombinase/integrase [Nonomuraea sp. NPDC049709]|uniref:site-specific integrase n=1 Tax=Nonomuraea sp. NPDC049709 TaxID=3154736 RepID=UPI00341416E5